MWGLIFDFVADFLLPRRVQIVLLVLGMALMLGAVIWFQVTAP